MARTKKTQEINEQITIEMNPTEAAEGILPVIDATPIAEVELPQQAPLTMEEKEQAMEEKNSIIRAAVNTVYDIQKLRIATGNRLIQTFMKRLSNSPTTDEISESEIKSVINQLISEYKLVTDAYINLFAGKGKIAPVIESLSDQISEINSELDYQMVGIYKGLLEQESQAVKIVDRVVKQHPLWDAFLKDVVGCGPLMSAVCISRLNPYKARHASSFWKYAGLDVVYETKQDGVLKTIDPIMNPTEAAESMYRYEIPTTKSTKHVHIEWDDGRAPYDADVVDVVVGDKDIKIEVLQGTFITLQMKEKDSVTRPNKRNGLTEPLVTPGAKIIDFDVTESTVDIPNGRAVGRSKRHTVDREYTTKAGTIATKRSITYNPFLKTKLMGVLADSFIKCPGSHYEQIYRGYRARMDSDPRHYGKTDAHKNMAAKRYAVKMFLADLWVAWRTIECLPVTEPYAVAKLGMQPHGFNY